MRPPRCHSQYPRSLARARAFVSRLGICVLVLFGGQAHALERPEGWELGLHSGPLLPSRIARVREIIQVVGLRASTPTEKGIFELEGFTGRGEGIFYNAISINYRADIPNPHLPVHALIGFHGDYYRPADSDQFSFASGWHFGGGVKQSIAGPLELRVDFQYRLTPGVSLYVGMGFTYLFGDVGGG